MNIEGHLVLHSYYFSISSIAFLGTSEREISSQLRTPFLGLTFSFKYAFNFKGCYLNSFNTTCFDLSSLE